MNHDPLQSKVSSPRRRALAWSTLARRGASALMVLLLGLVLWTFGEDRRGPDAQANAASWGHEALDTEPATLADWLPLAPANACGLGGSSCFKCHNGKRAGLPNMDQKKAPWHAQHSKVNNSCVGCHKGKRAAAPRSDPGKGPWHAQHAKVNNTCVGCHRGNPRVMKEDIAHAKMVAKPRDDSAGTCAGCHTSDLAKVKSAYTGGK